MTKFHWGNLNAGVDDNNSLVSLKKVLCYCGSLPYHMLIDPLTVTYHYCNWNCTLFCACKFALAMKNEVWCSQELPDLCPLLLTWVKSLNIFSVMW